MRRFEMILPGSVKDVVQALTQHNGAAKLVAGGTDLLPQLKNHLLNPGVVVDLSGVAALRELTQEGGGLRIGAAAGPMTEVAAACKERGLWPFTHFNRVHVVPPCTVTEAEVKEGLSALDEALSVAYAHATA